MIRMNDEIRDMLNDAPVIRNETIVELSAKILDMMDENKLLNLEERLKK